MQFNNDDVIKKEFIENIKRCKSSSSEDYYNLCIFIMKKVDEYESKMDVKLCHLSKEELLEWFGESGFKTMSSLKTSASILNKYIAYCNNSTSNIIASSDLGGLIDEEKLSKKNVTEKEYIQILRLRDTDNTINYQDLAMVVLLWRGIKGSEYIDIAEFKKKDFDYVDGTLSYKGRTIKLIPIESEILRKCIEETIYRHYGTKSREERVVELVSESDNLFKETAHFNAGSKLSYSSIKIRLSYFIGGKVKDISATDIYSSGVVFNVLKENNFKEMRIIDLDTKIKQRHQRVAYNRLNALRDGILGKLKE